MLINREFKKLSMFAVGGTIGIGWIRMRRIVLFWGEKLTIVTLLKLDNIGFTERRCHRDQFLGNFHLAHVVAASFSDQDWFLISHSPASLKHA